MIDFMRLSRTVVRPCATVVLLLMICTADQVAAVDKRLPEQIITETSTQVLKTLNENEDRFKESPEQVSMLINETVVPILDLTSMSKLVLGRYWKQASEEQRVNFISEFKDMLIRTYAKSLVDYGNAKIKVLPSHSTQEGKYRTVQTELDVGSGKVPLQVVYVFRSNEKNEWKVLDLKVDGLSLAKNFRSSFNQEIKETSLSALIERLADTGVSDATDGFQKDEQQGSKN